MAGRRRMFKVSEKIRQIIASQLVHSADPRLSLVTITGVAISSDLREAKVYWNVANADTRIQEVEDAFRRASGYFRNIIARELQIRFIPRLHFFYDDTLDTFEEVSKLLKRVQDERDERQPPPEEASDDDA